MDQIILQILTEVDKGNAFILIVLRLTIFGAVEVVKLFLRTTVVFDGAAKEVLDGVELMSEYLAIEN